jgi:hypothetical protein
VQSTITLGLNDVTMGSNFAIRTVNMLAKMPTGANACADAAGDNVVEYCSHVTLEYIGCESRVLIRDCEAIASA